MSAEAYANSGDYYVHIRALHNSVDIKFKAIMTSFKDNLTTKFNPEEVYGRIDPIMTFQNTTRKIAMTLEIPATDVSEAQRNFQSLSQLMASLYPGYSETNSATTISTPPLHKIKFANWVTSGGSIGTVADTGLVVALEGASFAPNMDAGVITNGPKILPKQFDLELQMTVLHVEQVGWNVDGWMGSRRYPYTEYAEDISLNNPEEGEANMSIDPVEQQTQNGTWYENVQEALEEQLLGPNSGTELGMSFEIE